MNQVSDIEKTITLLINSKSNELVQRVIIPLLVQLKNEIPSITETARHKSLVDTYLLNTKLEHLINTIRNMHL